MVVDAHLHVFAAASDRFPRDVHELYPAELEASNARLTESEQRRSLALVAGNMGSWDWDKLNGDCLWDEGQYRIFGVEPKRFSVKRANSVVMMEKPTIRKKYVPSTIANIAPRPWRKTSAILACSCGRARCSRERLSGRIR